MMARKIYNAERASVSGPYSHAVDAGEFVFLSGQTAMNTVGATQMTGDIATQTKECFANLIEVLKAGNLTLDDVVKVNVYLTDMNNFTAMNDVYKTYFQDPYPARTCVAVLALPLGAEVEIEMIAKRS
ncbi:Rid family detoxifying hydrolase [Bacillus sp. DTU_2020_1000418_1_SI_GHA_SEK_038]|uniref:RidA family protein n=1 Tax=Bacillus sp. DTU_2020_1000418_1_SI_GHA_SEK_038 TaxID=3077585 RepID=UPI0028EE9938|nr:Rid family detoxifying hydrolase [Bacillus sp. DTU_2020_1000418_1_SI_GHA_SEK_038]WNS76514.1 Rid family detoxifying hydrolase [Bacillus sp. DTU_2020_1000418_1_SI_GHA_SEK_038]